MEGISIKILFAYFFSHKHRAVAASRIRTGEVHLSGRRVTNPTKGIYIKQGKKLVNE